MSWPRFSPDVGSSGMTWFATRAQRTRSRSLPVAGRTLSTALACLNLPFGTRSYGAGGTSASGTAGSSCADAPRCRDPTTMHTCRHTLAPPGLYLDARQWCVVSAFRFISCVVYIYGVCMSVFLAWSVFFFFLLVFCIPFLRYLVICKVFCVILAPYYRVL